MNQKELTKTFMMISNSNVEGHIIIKDLTDCGALGQFYDIRIIM